MIGLASMAVAFLLLAMCYATYVIILSDDFSDDDD